MSSVTDIISGISYLLIAFVSISLVVSSIMIGIITYISVLERTKEIGILRAVGASKRDVSRVFNAETLPGAGRAGRRSPRRWPRPAWPPASPGSWPPSAAPPRRHTAPAPAGQWRLRVQQRGRDQLHRLRGPADELRHGYYQRHQLPADRLRLRHPQGKYSFILSAGQPPGPSWRPRGRESGPR